MPLPTRLLSCLVTLLGTCLVASATQPPRARVLVFTRTVGWHHDSIPTAVAALQRVAAMEGMEVDVRDDAAAFTPGNLTRYRAVVFANTTGDVLDDTQQAAMERFVRAGGGYMGLHSAADTEYDWPWYGELVGAWFKNHPPGLQSTQVLFEADSAAPVDWRVRDELYNYRSNPRGRVTVLATVQERDYEGGEMGEDHPITWCRDFDGGRSWYTGLGHDQSMYADPVFLAQLRGGLRFVTGVSRACGQVYE